MANLPDPSVWLSVGWFEVDAEFVGLSDIEWLLEKVTPALGGVTRTAPVAVEVEAGGTRAERAASTDLAKPSHQLFQCTNESSPNCGLQGAKRGDEIAQRIIL